MERGIYFDGWFPNDHCYHPSMPPRRAAMLDDVADMRGTILVWAGLGGGTISLPYLEEEAYGAIPARYRQHGFMTDAEFIAAAKQRGIDLFAIVFEAQAWEFPAVIDENGDVSAQNQLTDGQTGGTVGLREFSSDTGPRSWKPFSTYFPGGLHNSNGELVADLWEEVASRDLEGNALHATWVEVPENAQQCHLADRNNPVWREYLKAIVRIQIDAGAPGIQLDESDVPLLSLRYGGCFCKDCVKGFRQHLLALADTPEELSEVDLNTFDYRTWLLAQGYRARTAPQALPLYSHYVNFLMQSTVATFLEVARYVHDYAQEVGKKVRVAGNFYDCAPIYDGMVEEVDVCVTEMRETKYQQPWYFRHGVGMARGRPLIAVENPYGGITEDLNERLKRGRGRDLFRMSIYEAAAMGGSMSLPYGSWLGSVTKDSYWAPRDLCIEIGEFLESIDHLLSPVSDHRTAVLCPIASLQRAVLDSDQFFDDNAWFERPVTETPPASYWEVIEHLSRSALGYDVVILPDERFRPTTLSPADLQRYDTLVVPDAWAISPAQDRLLTDYCDGGGRVLVHGAYGTELPDAGQLPRHDNCNLTSSLEHLSRVVVADVVVDGQDTLAVCRHSLQGGNLAVHVLNYDFDVAEDRTRSSSGVQVAIRTTNPPSRATLHQPGSSSAGLTISDSEGWSTVEVPELGTYSVIHYEWGTSQ